MAYQTYFVSAIQQLLTYMNDVAQIDLPQLNIAVYMGIPTEENIGGAQNTLSIGDWSSAGSNIISGFSSSWRGLGNVAVQPDRNQPFSIHWSVVAWDGSDGGDPATSPALVNVGLMFDAMLNRILADPTGSGNLGPNGYWDTINMVYPLYGPVAGGGVQSVLECAIGVKTVNIGTVS